jgi:hypothetical protein
MRRNIRKIGVVILVAIGAASAGIYAGSHSATIQDKNPSITQPVTPPVTQPVTLNYVCTITTGEFGNSGWTAAFTNNNPAAVAVQSYTVVFFNSAGVETGSGQSATDPFTIAGYNSYTDIENTGESQAAVPVGTSTCQVANWVQETP